MRYQITRLNSERRFVSINSLSLIAKIALTMASTALLTPSAHAERLACYNFSTACRCFPTYTTGPHAKGDVPQLECNGRTILREEVVAQLSFSTNQKFVVASGVLPSNCSNPCTGASASGAPARAPTQLNPPTPLNPPATMDAPPAPSALGGPHPVLPPPVPYPNGVWDGEESPQMQGDQVEQQASEPAFPPTTGPSELPAPAPSVGFWARIANWFNEHAAKDQNVNLGTVSNGGSN